MKEIECKLKCIKCELIHRRSERVEFKGKNFIELRCPRCNSHTIDVAYNNERKEPAEILHKWKFLPGEKNIRCHKLKTLKPFFNDVLSGIKSFEVRRYDKDFKIGDILFLSELENKNLYSGRSVAVRITYIMTDSEYVKKDLCILGIEKINPLNV